MTDRIAREHNRISTLGMVVLCMALLSLIVVLWTSYQDRRDTECQKDLNARFLVVLKERASIADGDRAAVQTLVKSLVKAENDQETAMAIAEYQQANNDLDEQRAKVQYPADTELCN